MILYGWSSEIFEFNILWISLVAMKFKETKQQQQTNKQTDRNTKAELHAILGILTLMNRTIATV